MIEQYISYIEKINETMKNTVVLKTIKKLNEDLIKLWEDNGTLYICGNGGSAGNAIHIANDYVYGIGKGIKKGLKTHALTANTSIITCLANDLKYEHIFSEQIKLFGQEKDILLALSGSGNSINIINAIKECKKKKMITHAIIGYDGGEIINLADNAIHVKINDMQIAEDSQLIINHMIMQNLAGYKK